MRPPRTSIAATHQDGILYLTGLGGLNLIRADGSATTLTSEDGLVSNATQDITTGPAGSLWVATDAGVSVRVGDNQ